MKGCVLAGRFRFSNPAKNRATKPSGEQAEAGHDADDSPSAG